MLSQLAEVIEEENLDRAPSRKPGAWVRVLTDAKPATGAECVVRVNANGDHWVGRLLSRDADPCIEIELLGARAGTPSLLFERRAVTVSTLPAHRWGERQIVAARQRQGLPAAVRAPGRSRWRRDVERDGA